MDLFDFNRLTDEDLINIYAINLAYLNVNYPTGCQRIAPHINDIIPEELERRELVSLVEKLELYRLQRSGTSGMTQLPNRRNYIEN